MGKPAKGKGRGRGRGLGKDAAAPKANAKSGGAEPPKKRSKRGTDKQDERTERSTFAKRFAPTKNPSRMIWEDLRFAFNKIIRDNVRSPTKMEDCC